MYSIRLYCQYFLDKALKDNLEYIKNETLAIEINFVEKLSSPNEFEFDDIKLELEINKVI